ncbi:MAG: tetratricopeptide repeat protein [Cyanobacteria bacterium]|nr:tetratricopeptide repeat protein [Cyanobacteriota bacterium]
MENSNLLLTYLATLLGLLAIAAALIVRQVFKTRRVETTLNRLQNKVSKEKGNAQEYYELGSLLLDKKLYTQATAQLKQALIAFLNLVKAYIPLILNALGYAYFAQDQYDLAIRHYKDALEKEPGYVTALNNLGHSYERKQLTTQALESYEQALRLEPDNKTAKRRADSLRKRVAPASEA